MAIDRIGVAAHPMPLVRFGHAGKVQGPVLPTVPRNDQFTAFSKRGQILFVLNSQAGHMMNRSLEEEKQAILKAVPESDRSRVRFFDASTPDALRQKIAQDHGNLDRVIAVGGDGTVNHVISSVIPYPDINVGIVPMGTGNILARNLGIPKAIREAVKTALGNNTIPIKVGLVHQEGSTHNQHFIVMTGAGVDAEVLRAIRPESKAKLGILAYYRGILKQVFQQKPIEFTIKVDGETVTRTGKGIAISCVKNILGPFSITPGADQGESTLDIAILELNRPWDYLKALYQVLLKKPGDLSSHGGLINVKAKHVTVQTKQVTGVQRDGDLLDTALGKSVALSFNVAANPISIMTPPKDAI